MMHDKYKACVDLCYEAAMMSDKCAFDSLQEKDVSKLVKCIELNIYCSEMCRLAARFMALGDLYVSEILKLCADICEACGNECAKHPHDHCQRSAAVCKICADECRSMLN